LYQKFLSFNESDDRHQLDEDDTEYTWDWPEKMLPICYRGCTVYECLDCRRAEPSVLAVDIGDEVCEESFHQPATSLQAWMEEWLDETDGPEPQWFRQLDDGQNFRTVTWRSFGGELFPTQMPWLVHLKHLTGLGLNGPRITDEHCIQLVHVPRLESLFLHGTKITDAGLAHVAELEKLNALDIGETQISDAGLSRLTDLPLETLSLGHTAVTGLGLRHLHAIKTLKFLDLTCVAVTESELTELEAALSECEVNWWPPGVTDG
jgi:hypothetical protein